MKNTIIGITIGDPAGIGPEVTAAALRNPHVSRLGPVKIIGDAAALQPYLAKMPQNCEMISPGVLSKRIKPGRPSAQSARASLEYLQTAVQCLKDRTITALVTAPLCKEAIHGLPYPFQGHTEYLAGEFRVKDVEMMFVTESLKTIIVTRHIPLKDVPRAVTAEKVEQTIRLGHTALKTLFKILAPRIAVCGINPHAGEGGTIGHDEQTKILPALKRLRKARIRAEGPFAADTLFVPENARAYDLIIAMYHDQGLAPVKAVAFHDVVNLTVGLPFIRTSPAHGTAFNIAGQNKADSRSMEQAILLAARLSAP